MTRYTGDYLADLDAEWIRAADPTRLIHYHPAGEAPVVDVVATEMPSGYNRATADR